MLTCNFHRDWKYIRASSNPSRNIFSLGCKIFCCFVLSWGWGYPDSGVIIVLEIVTGHQTRGGQCHVTTRACLKITKKMRVALASHDAHSFYLWRTLVFSIFWHGGTIVKCWWPNCYKSYTTLCFSPNGDTKLLIYFFWIFSAEDKKLIRDSGVRPVFILSPTSGEQRLKTRFNWPRRIALSLFCSIAFCWDIKSEIDAHEIKFR